jgi:uncharacterized membrane protein YfcA
MVRPERGSFTTTGLITALGVLGPVLIAVWAGVPEALLGGMDPTFLSTFRSHWWIFPASIAFSAVALAAGVSGALFFSPFFILVVGLAPAQAIGAGLLTEVFGMGNGLLNYVREGLVDYATAKWLLLGAIPAVVLGAVAAHYVPTRVLKGLFGVGLLFLGGYLLVHDSPTECDPGDGEGPYLASKNDGRGETVIETRDGTVYRYDTCWRVPGVSLSAVGGFITGLISAGLPEVTTTQLIVRCRVPPRVAIATSVFVLGIAAIAGAAVHALAATPVWYVVGWSIPGVLVGGTLGTRLGKYVPSETMEPVLGGVFGVVGGIVLLTEFVL